MVPQRRELTVMFSDLVGFTGVAERLGAARTAAVLSRYLGAMTEALQEHGATLDKYLSGPKALVRFTEAEGADLHCEPKTPALRAQRIFDWLDATLPGA